MEILVALTHVTSYHYDRPVALGPQTVRLRPGPALPHADQELLAQISAAAPFHQLAAEAAGRCRLARIVFPERTRGLKIEVGLTAELAVINPFDFFVDALGGGVSFGLFGRACRRADPLSRGRGLSGALLEGGSWPPSRRAKRQTVQFLVDLKCAGSTAEIRYVVRPETGVQEPEETLTLRSGLLQEYGLAVRANPAPPRHRGAFRIRLPDPAYRRHRPDRGAEGHAGPISPTCTPGSRPICRAPAGSGSTRPRAFSSARGISRSPPPRVSRLAAAPITGSAEVANVDFGFEMRVDRLSKSPRVTKPFSEESWQKLDALGERVDADLLPHRMCASPWAASRPSCRSTISRAPKSGTSRRSGRRSAFSPTISSAGCVTASHPAVSCITARANGIRARACRAGPSGSIGARTASRSGTMPRWSRGGGAKA